MIKIIWLLSLKRLESLIFMTLSLSVENNQMMKKNVREHYAQN